MAKPTRRTPKRRPGGGPLMYSLDLDLATIEELEQGRCPESLANRAHDLLRWRREAIRALTPKRSPAA
jgi:hypothetical protein